MAELAKVPTVFVFYFSGSSGEFLARTLTETFVDIARNHAWWEDDNRVKVRDLYGRSFNSGDEYFDDDIVLRRANTYFENLEKPGKVHLGLMHPHHMVVPYFLKNFSHHPVIEITLIRPESQLFAHIASRQKIKHIDQTAHAPLHRSHSWIIPNCLQVEWYDLMFKPQCVFDAVSKFLNLSGDQQLFVDFVEEYKTKNQDLVGQIHAS